MRLPALLSRVARLALAALAASCLALAPAAARAPSDAERQALTESIAKFDAAMRASDFPAVIAQSISPRMLAFIAENAGMEIEALRAVVAQQMQAALADVKLSSFGMDLAGAENRELADGTPYVLIPTETVLDAGAAGKIRVRSHTLALIDEGQWFLLRVSDPQQVALLRQVYPAFAGVEFPAGSTEAVE